MDPNPNLTDTLLEGEVWTQADTVGSDARIPVETGDCTRSGASPESSPADPLRSGCVGSSALAPGTCCGTQQTNTGPIS